MIEAVKPGNYESYNITSSSSSTAYKKQEEAAVFDIQTLLKSLGEYTYSEDDIGSVDGSLADGLKKKFNVSDEEIYNLKKNGYDLERLYMEDASYYYAAQSTQAAGQVNTNTSAASQISEKVNVIKEQNDNMYLYALTSKEPVTINSLYQSNFKGNFKKTNASYTDKDINKLMEMNGLQNTKGNKWAVSKLVEYGMDVNQQDAVKLQNMKAAVECLDEQEEIKKANEDLVASRQPGNRPLLKDDKVAYDYTDVKEIKDDLGKITDEDIAELVVGDEEITIGNLRATLFKNTDLALRQVKAPTLNQYQEQVAQDIKDQINVIRAKLTTEAAQKISEKMPLESSQLSDVAKELTAIENEKISEVAKEANIELTPENTEIIRNVIEARQVIIENREQTLNLEMASEEKILLNEIHAALAKYGQNELQIEQRFGESIKSVEGQIEGLLNELGIKVTAETIQAAKALIMNGLEVNEENIAETLNIMVKINSFIEEMTPSKAAVLIKEGLNPYTSSIDTLLDWISEEKIEELKNSIAETIVALEEKGIVSSEQKNALLGFYRIMQSVSKNREEVVGYIFKNNLPLTMERLQEATKYIGSKSIIEAAVDDSFGEIKELKYDAQTARMILEESQEQISKSIDIINLLEKMALPITENNIDKLKKINALLYPIIKEQFKKELGKFDGMETLPKSFLDKLDTIKKVDPKVISYMLKEGITPTVSNIYWTDQILKYPETYKEMLKDGELLKEEMPKTFEEIESELNRQEEEASKQKESALEKGNIVEYKTYKHIEEVVHLQKELSQKDGVYQIPFMIQGEEKMVHLYFNKKQSQSADKDDSTTAVMSYETKNLGVITAYIHFKGEDLSYKVQGETKEITAKLQKNSAWLNDLLNSIGYAVKGIQYEAAPNEDSSHSPSFIKKGDSQFEEVI